MTEPTFLTTREVADLLRVKERKVYDMAAEGVIPHRRVTGKLLFPRAEIDLWLSNGTSRAPLNVPSVIAGSHDPLLDWAIRESGAGLATFFDGSLDGLERMRKGQASAAGLHVFEPKSETWNIGHVREAMTDRSVVLVEWARRQQGLILSEHVADNVFSVGDLAGLTVAQRQSSAGAGLLFGHLLEEAGLSNADVHLLPDLAHTETEAAAAVASGKADAAPGLEAVARQFGLAFEPTRWERFDLVVDRRSWFEPPLQALMSFARSDDFAAKSIDLGGYDLSGHGVVHWNSP